MATSFAVQQPQHVNFHPYHHRQGYSLTPPSSGTPPSANISPTNVTLPPKQIFPARRLGYTPAALRPTDIPNKNKRPLTPPRSAHSSLDSQATQSTLSSKSLPVTPIDDVSSFIAPLGQISRVVTDEWTEELGEVKGQPTRGHWQPDSTATCCTSPTCPTVFTFLARRHHCRRCGGIYCFSHSAKLIPLDQDARFHPKGVLARSCDNCWTDYGLWQYERKSRASSINSGGTATPPVSFLPGQQQQEIRGSDFIGGEHRKQSVVGKFGGESVRDTDYNWSTF